VKKSIFISKNASELPLLSTFCVSHQFTLSAHSLITFNALSFEMNVSYDVVFFSSIRAAAFFLAQEKLPEHCQIACVGAVTAKKINALGFGVSFIGEQAGNPLHVAEMFKMWLGERRVLFPLSTVSKRTIVEQIPPHQRCEVTIYETCALPLKIEKSDYLIFTSPSNVESYLLQNEINGNILIAWGTTTRNALEAKGFSVDFTLQEANEENLITYLKEFLIL
jgi:uroporphyrinogen-III synthase